jgi:hypothetical protein
MATTPSEHVPLVRDHPPLDTDELQLVNDNLQDVLLVLSDLALLGKQAHWNLVGPRFRELHLQLDELVAAWREQSDDVAERIVALGGYPTGRRPRSRRVLASAVSRSRRFKTPRSSRCSPISSPRPTKRSVTR